MHRLALKSPSYLQLDRPLLWVLAFASATQDICVDGVYITALEQGAAGRVDRRPGAFWNAGRIFGTAGVVGSPAR